MKGYVQRLNKAAQNSQVIVLSAKVDVQNKVQLLLTGAADYMTKPFDISELLALYSLLVIALTTKSRKKSPFMKNSPRILATIKQA